MFTAVVYSGEDPLQQGTMNRKKAEKKSGKTKTPHWVRASISFPPDLYETLEEIAGQKKVSLAWVVRDAAEKYVASGMKRTKEGAE